MSEDAVIKSRRLSGHFSSAGTYLEMPLLIYFDPEYTPLNAPSLLQLNVFPKMKC